mgnify:CR=1 FL=1
MPIYKYKAIGFDYGGVIGGNSSNGAPFTQKVCKLLGITKQDFDETYFSMNHLMQLGELDSWEEFWRLFLQKLGKGSEKLDDIIVLNTEVERNLKIVDDKILELVDSLRGMGYKLGLLSNTTLKGAADMRALGIPAHFDVFHASSEVKHMKPRVDAFIFFAEALGVEMSELVFIDDTEKSLSTASECGYTPVLYTGYRALLDSLSDLGVL